MHYLINFAGMMKDGNEYNILVVAFSGDTLFRDEIDALRRGFRRVEQVELADSEGSGGVRALLRAAASLHGKTRRISDMIQARITSGIDAVIVYGGGVTASAAVSAGRRSGVPVIIRLGRCQLDYEKCFSEAAGVIAGSRVALTRLHALARGAQIKGMSAYNVIPGPESVVSCHDVSSHALTFISEGKPQESMRLVMAMALARPGSKIRWICLDGTLPEFKGKAPDNFSATTAASLYEAVSRESVDWMIMPEETPTYMPSALLQALAAGMPVIAVDSPFIEEAVTDDCGVLFGPDPQNEEFVKGLFPYVESDYRMNSLRAAARQRWAELFSPDAAGRRLVETICLCLSQK